MPPPSVQPTKLQRKAEQRKRAEARHARHLLARRLKWNPKAVTPHHSRDAYKTLFVARLARHLTAADVKAEFEYYGPIAHCHVVHERPRTAAAAAAGGGGEAVNAAGAAAPAASAPASAAGVGKEERSRGYAFVEFVSNSDMTEAYRDADGRKIAGRRIVVDVERGRTVKQWTPRRLGGGLGGTRLGGKEVNQTHSGREADKGRDKDRVDKDRDSSSRRAVSRERGGAAHSDRRDDGDRRVREAERDKVRERAEQAGSRDRRYGDREADRERDRERERDSHRDAYRDRERSGRAGGDSRSERDRERDRGGGGGGGDREAYWRGGSTSGGGGGSSSGAGIGYREDRGRADRGERWERDRFRPERSNSRGR